MIDSFYRNPYQKILIDPLLNTKLFKNINPIFITLLATVMGISSLVFLLYNQNLFATFALLLSGYFDTLDGSVARTYNKTSSLGAVLDIVSDRVVEFALLLGLFLQDPTRALLVILMIGSILLCITSFLVVGIFSENDSQKSFYYSPGLMERTEAFLFFVLLTLLPSMFIPLASLFVSLVLLTTLLRLWQFGKNSKLVSCLEKSK